MDNITILKKEKVKIKWTVLKNYLLFTVHSESYFY